MGSQLKTWIYWLTVNMVTDYPFVSTGIAGKLITLDAGDLVADLRSDAIQLFQAVEAISRHLFF